MSLGPAFGFRIDRIQVKFNQKFPTLRLDLSSDYRGFSLDWIQFVETS